MEIIRTIPEDNLAYPILIQLSDNGTGTGFLVNCPEFACLVTAKHVILPNTDASLEGLSADLRCYTREFKETDCVTLHLKLDELDASGHVLLSANHDVAIIRVFRILDKIDKGYA